MSSPRRWRVLLIGVLGIVFGLTVVAIALRWTRGLGISWILLGITAIAAGVFGARIRAWSGGGQGEEVLGPWLAITQILIGIAFLSSGTAYLLDAPATPVFVVQMVFYGLALVAVLVALFRWLSR